MVINWTKVYNILGFFRSTNTLFEKMALKDFVFFCIFSLATGPLELAKLPECFYGNKLDKGVQYTGVL